MFRLARAFRDTAGNRESGSVLTSCGLSHSGLIDCLFPRTVSDSRALLWQSRRLGPKLHLSNSARRHVDLSDWACRCRRCGCCPTAKNTGNVLTDNDLSLHAGRQDLRRSVVAFGRADRRRLSSRAS